MKSNQLAVVIVIVLIVGVLGYLGRHQIKSMLMGTSSQPTPTTEVSTSPNTTYPSPSSSSAMVNNDIVMTKNDPSKGYYLTDSKGITLYSFDKDAKWNQ